MLPQLPYRRVELGVKHLGRNFRSGLHDETSEAHARMRDGKLRCFDDLLIIEKQVNVKLPSTPALDANAAVALFDIDQLLMNLLGRERSRKFRRRIEIIGLPAGTTDRFGDQQFASCFQRKLRIGSELVNGLSQGFAQISEIRAQGNQNGGHKSVALRAA